MSTDVESLRRLEFALELQLNWIKASETRISIILPISTAMLGALAFITSNNELNSDLLVSGMVAAFLLVSSILLAASAYFPRTDSPHYSNIFFGSIAGISVDEFERNLKARSIDEYEHDLIIQIHRNACITDVKYRRFRYAMTAMILAVVPWFIAILSNSGLMNGAKG